MDAWDWVSCVGCVLACGCGTSVMVDGTRPAPEENEPPIDDPPTEAPLPEPACGGSTTRVSVTVRGSGEYCSFDDGWQGEFDRVDPLPDGSGVALHAIACGGSACDCTIDVRGIGTSFATVFGKPEHPVALDGQVQPDHIQLTESTICKTCYPCPCLIPLPALFAADGDIDDIEMPSTLVVDKRGETCHETLDGCESAAYSLRARAYRVDGGIAGVLEVASIEAAEGESIVNADTGLMFTVLRGSGRSTGCAGAAPGLEIGKSAWVVTGPVRVPRP